MRLGQDGREQPRALLATQLVAHTPDVERRVASCGSLDVTRQACQSPIEMSLTLPIRDVTRGQGIALCLPLRSRPWRQAARLSWSGLLGRAAADPSLGRVTSQTGRMVTFQSGAYTVIPR